MKKMQMMLALACMASLTACQEEGNSTSSTNSSNTSSSTQVETTTDATSSGGDSGTIIPATDFSETIDDVSLKEEIETSEKDAKDVADIPKDTQLEDSGEVSNDDIPFELPEDEELRELLIYINEVDMIIESFEDSLRTISGTAVEYLLDPENTSLFDTYCQNMVDAGITLREIGAVLPPEEYASLHAAFAEDCESLSDAYQQMVHFLQSGIENSEESMKLEMDMVELFTNMQESFFTLGEKTMDDYNG